MTELESKTRAELVKLASAAGVSNAVKKTKAELLELLSETKEVVSEVEAKVEDVAKSELPKVEPAKIGCTCGPGDACSDPNCKGGPIDDRPFSDEQIKAEKKALLTTPTFPSPFGRRVAAKGVLYTDGISGPASQNLERAYEIHERLQSNDPKIRQSGDESLSEAAKDQKTSRENKEADTVKQGYRIDSSRGY